MKEKYSIIRSADRYIEQRQYDKAIKAYQALIASGEQDPSVINALGDLQYKNGDQASAIKNYAQAASIYSDSGDSLKAVGLCRKILRNAPENNDALELFLDLNQKRDAVFESRSLLADLVEDAAGEGNFIRAAELQERLTKISRKNSSAHLLLAEFQFASGSQDQAAEYVRRAIELAVASKGDAEAGLSWITELLEARSCFKGFPDFVREIKEGYLSRGGTVSSILTEPLEEELPPPAPSVEESLSSPEFFEVDGSLESGENLESGEDAGFSPTGEFDLEEKLASGALDEDAETVIESEIEDFPVEEEALGEPGDILAVLSGEDSQQNETEFELDIDEDQIVESSEELLEMLGSDYQEDLSSGEEPGSEEVPAEFEPESQAEVEENGFELDLDKTDLSLADFESLGIEDLGEPEAPDLNLAEQPEESSSPAEEEPEFLQESAREVASIGESGEIEAALEGIFSLDQEVEQSTLIIPNEIPEQEYPTSGSGEMGIDTGASAGDPSEPDDDPEVQLELGIAYRDMVLLEDAIGKFENALAIFEERKHKDKCVLCCQLLSECCNSLKRYRDALDWVSRGLDYRKVSDDELVSFEYESALALEALGDYSESLQGLRRIQSIHPGFRDVESRISSLESAEH